MDLKVGDKVVIKYLAGLDEENGVRVGDVAKVVAATKYDEGYWCFNPRWRRSNEEIGGNYMRLDQLQKIGL